MLGRRGNITVRVSVQMKNCNFSSINTLELDSISFDRKSVDTLILTKLASQFSNLKQLKIRFGQQFDQNVVLFWQLLKPIISKNGVQVELDIRDMWDSQYDRLNELTHENHLLMNKLTVYNWGDDRELKLIQQRDKCGLKHLIIKSRNSIQLIYQVLFESINILQIGAYGLPINDINDFLRWTMIIEKELSVIADFSLNYSQQHKDTFLSLFKRLCGAICKLFVEQIAVNTKMLFKEVDREIFDSCLAIYTSCIESARFLKEYKKHQTLYMVRNAKLEQISDAHNQRGISCQITISRHLHSKKIVFLF